MPVVALFLVGVGYAGGLYMGTKIVYDKVINVALQAYAEGLKDKVSRN
jgi:hypothetical protein